MEHQIWDQGSGSGPKGGYYIEVHQRGGYIVPQGRVQGHYCPHGW